MTSTTVPDTFRFMVAGYAVILVGLGLYALSLVARFRRLKRQEKWIDELEKEERSKKGGQAQ